MEDQYCLAGRLIREKLDELSEAVVERIEEKASSPNGSLDDGWRSKSVRDVGYHLGFLSESLSVNEPILFREYVGYVRILFSEIKFNHNGLQMALYCAMEVITERLPVEAAGIASTILAESIRYLDSSTSGPRSHLNIEASLGELAKKYFDFLIRGDKNRACDLMMRAVEDGIAVRRIYLEVFQPCLREVGRLWQMNKIGIATEHYVTAATQEIMARLYPFIQRGPRNGRRLVASTVSGELHEIGLRMVADFLDMEGWDAYYAGPNLPPDGLLRIIEERKPSLIALSTTLPIHINELRHLIERIRETAVGQKAKIIVGGYPFNVSAKLWNRIGADGSSADAQDALYLVSRLFPGSEYASWN